MSNFPSLYQSFSPDPHIRGKQFERLCRWFLETDPHYSSRLQKVWLWEDWPDRWGADCGIDLIAKDADGKIWAIQAKCYDPTYSVTKHDIDKFLSESVNEKIDFRLLIATTDLIGGNSRKVILRQNERIPVSLVLLNDLEQAPLVWPSSVEELGTGRVAEKSFPRPHQMAAIEATVSSLVDRGQMIMACGTGKTLTALWIAEKLESKRTLVLLPSLLLLSKTLADWVTHANQPFAYLPVCSDETASKAADTVMSSTADLAFPSTTDAGEIASFLRSSGTRVVFSTYQSSPKIAEAFRQDKVPEFDLVIADEAHRCAGKVDSEYSTVLDNDAIPSKKRLFMTATPRVYTPHLRKTAADSGYDVASMDDQAVFGPVLHRLTFGQAIAKNLLSDYQVVVVGIDNPTYQQMVTDRSLVETETGITSDARSLASHVGLAKAMDKYDLRRVITFHSRVNWASQFATELSEVVDWMPKQYRPSGQLISSYVSGDMSTSLRNQRLGSLADLEDGQRAVLANARCLSEGVDVPALDGVAFIDPRKSEIDIVQAVGRAIRLSPEKVKGTIIIPVFISDADDPDVALSSSEFDKVWKVVNALRAHDDALGEELDRLRTQLGERGSTQRPTKIVFDIPNKIGKQFASAFETRLVESSTASWYFKYGLLKVFADQNGHPRPTQRFKTKDGFLLGSWVSTQRNTRNQLSMDRVARLESLPGWTWDGNLYRWEMGYNFLRAFVDQEGHARVAQSFLTQDGYELGSWVSRQRQIKDTLTPDQVSQLESLTGWTWDATIARWQEGFGHLKTFVKQEGHARVHYKYVTGNGYFLGRWISHQRKIRQQLSAEQITCFESLPDWIWLPPNSDTKWEEGFRRLEVYVDVEGHARVPISYITVDGYRLGAWSGKQRDRKGQLSHKRIVRLESLPGWTWDPFKSRWEDDFFNLKAFVEKEGHARVPTTYTAEGHHSLYSWVSRQRQIKDTLTPDQVSQLESLTGWSWLPSHDAKWVAGFDHLEAYVSTEGHARVPSTYCANDGYRLGTWVGNQRRRMGSLSGEKIALLEALPKWTWDSLNAKWDEGFRQLEIFVKKEGHARVRQNFETDDGYALGSWATVQRRNKDKLSVDDVNRLESLSGWVWGPRAARWEESFRDLELFVEKEGHARVFSNYTTADGNQLGRWVSRQRTRKHTLSPERIVRLETLPGWVWKV